MAFFLLSFTADEFLSPSLQEISKTFRLSESLAGVTLMAMGGGAPDLIASLTAAQGGDLEGIEMGIAVLVGSSLFILAIINAGILWYSPGTIKMNKQFFTRDALFLLVAIIVLLYSIVFRGKLDLVMSVIFIVLYCAYAVIVVYQDRLHEQEANSEVAKQAALAANMTELNTLTNFGQRPKDIDTMDPLKAYDFEGQFKQESSAFYYVDRPSRETAANE